MRGYKLRSVNLAMISKLAIFASRAVITLRATLVRPRPAPGIPRDLERMPVYKRVLSGFTPDPGAASLADIEKGRLWTGRAKRCWDARERRNLRLQDSCN